MAERLSDFAINELERVFAKNEKEIEEFKNKVEELKDEKSMYESEFTALEIDSESMYEREFTALKIKYEELTDAINSLQKGNTQCVDCVEERRRMVDREELKNRKFDDIIRRLINHLAKLREENEIYENYIQVLQRLNEIYKNKMKDICLKPSSLGKIPIYVLRRKHKYPYFIIRTANYQKVLECIKTDFENLKEVYKVNFDYEETYSRYLEHGELKKREKDIDIDRVRVGDTDVFVDDILLKHCTEKEFVEDLKNIFVNDQNGCHTLSLIKREEYPYYASRVQKERLGKAKKECEKNFPYSQEICTLPELPNAIMLHNRIKEKFPGHVLGNNIKLPDTYTEKEFIREVKRMAEPSLSL